MRNRAKNHFILAGLAHGDVVNILKHVTELYRVTAHIFTIYDLRSNMKQQHQEQTKSQNGIEMVYIPETFIQIEFYFIGSM